MGPPQLGETSHPTVLTQAVSLWKQEIGLEEEERGTQDSPPGDECAPWWQKETLSLGQLRLPHPDPGLNRPGAQARGLLPMPGSGP